MKIKPSGGFAMARLRLSAIPLLSAVLLLSAGCAQQVVTKVWKPASEAGYPEIYDEEIKNAVLRRAAPSGKDAGGAEAGSLGIVFSGGGTRSAAATLGELQALKLLGWFDQAHYVSAVSGGAWASIPFFYLSDKYCEAEKEKAGKGDGKFDCDAAFLGQYVPPHQLTVEDARVCSEGSFCHALTEAKFKFWTNNVYYMYAKLTADETFAHYLGNMFLKPFGLDGDRYFSGDLKYAQSIFDDDGGENKVHMQDSEVNVNVLRAGRPFLVVGSTLMSFRSNKPHYFLPVEFTPFYAGVPVKSELHYQALENEIGTSPSQALAMGGYVEPFAYDFPPPRQAEISVVEKNKTEHRTNNLIRNGKRFRFSLQDVMAATGAAPQQTLYELGIGPLGVLTENIGFPEFVYWGSGTKSHVAYREQVHGDGGHLDNLGIMPLLARKVDRIIVFANTMMPFYHDDMTADLSIYDNVISFFDLSDKWGAHKKTFTKQPHNVVFMEEDFDKLVAGFKDRKKRDEPLVYCQQYRVLGNERYNIKYDENYKPKICWVYLDRTQKWLDEIKASDTLCEPVKYDLVHGLNEFERFPHYWTFFNDLPEITAINKTRNQSIALSNLAAWNVLRASGYLSDELRLTRDPLGVQYANSSSPDDKRLLRKYPLKIYEGTGGSCQPNSSPP